MLHLRPRGGILSTIHDYPTNGSGMNPMQEALDKLEAFRVASVGSTFPEAEARVYAESVAALSREDRIRFLQEGMAK
jgi:hypothetical protein